MGEKSWMGQTDEFTKQITKYWPDEVNSVVNFALCLRTLIMIMEMIVYCVIGTHIGMNSNFWNKNTEYYEVKSWLILCVSTKSLTLSFMDIRVQSRMFFWSENS